MIENELITGKPVIAGEKTLVPEAKRTTVRFPGGRRGRVSVKPAAVLVLEPGGRETTVPVRDKTRTAQNLIALATLLGALALRLARG